MGEDLFTYRPPPVRRDHPETSYRAANKVAPVTGQLRSQVYALAVERGHHGITDAEIFERWPETPENSLRPRRIELVDAGRLTDSGRRRKNQRGRDCIVWTTPEHKEEEGNG